MPEATPGGVAAHDEVRRTVLTSGYRKVCACFGRAPEAAPRLPSSDRKPGRLLAGIGIGFRWRPGSRAGTPTAHGNPNLRPAAPRCADGRGAEGGLSAVTFASGGQLVVASDRHPSMARGTHLASGAHAWRGRRGGEKPECRINEFRARAPSGAARRLPATLPMNIRRSIAESPRRRIEVQPYDPGLLHARRPVGWVLVLGWHP